MIANYMRLEVQLDFFFPNFGGLGMEKEKKTFGDGGTENR